MNSRGFSLFEVLLALGVFAIAVTGLAMALDSAVNAALEARARSLARIQLQSRISACLADPPAERRIIEARENNGVRVEETMTPMDAKTASNTPIPGLWKLKIVADWGSGNHETADLIIYRP